jgi:hypothetical protein
MTEVTSIVIGSASAGSDAMGAADGMSIPSVGGLRDAAERAASELVWILDAAAMPNDETLPALVAAHGGPVASLPLGPDGQPFECLLGRFTDDDPPALVHAALHRRIPLRHTSVVSLLISRATVLANDPPDPALYGTYAGSEWTARVFAGDRGELVPESVVKVSRRPPVPSLADFARMSRTRIWGRGETLRELHRSVDRAGVLGRFAAARGFD